jgi:ferrous iron transport protein B
LPISVVLWFSWPQYGPGKKFNNAEKIVIRKNLKQPLAAARFENTVASQKLEKLLYWSYGKTVEPAISPLGYDLENRIAIISSFT